MDQNNALALDILDHLSVPTLNAMACELAARGKVEQLRFFQQIKGDVPFVAGASPVPGYGFHDPIEKAAEKNQLVAVQTLLEMGYSPTGKVVGETHYCGALQDAFENIVKAQTDAERELATDVAITLYRVVRSKYPSNFVLFLNYGDRDYGGQGYGKTPRQLLGEPFKPTTTSTSGRVTEKPAPHNTLLAHCVSNNVTRLRDEILSDVVAAPSKPFTDRDAQVLVVAHDIANFGRVMRHLKAVSTELLTHIIKLPEHLQTQAIDIIRDKDLPADFFKELGKLTSKMLPDTLDFVLQKVGKELEADEVLSLFVSAVREDNLTLMRTLLAIGEQMPDFFLDRKVTETSSNHYTTEYIALHSCRSAEAVRILVAHGADIERKDKENKTPLQTAVERGDGAAPVVSALIDAGADLDVRYKGRTLLQLAGTKAEGVKAVLRSGKTVTAVDSALDAKPESASSEPRRKTTFSPL